MKKKTEKLLKKILDSCPTYHCRTQQIRPDKRFGIKIEDVKIFVCNICFVKWNTKIQSAKKQTKKSINFMPAMA